VVGSITVVALALVTNGLLLTLERYGSTPAAIEEITINFNHLGAYALEIVKYSATSRYYLHSW
jgi:hypothetical protein